MNQKQLVMNGLTKGPKGARPPVANPTLIACHAGVDVLCPECAIPCSTPLENLKAIVDAAKGGY
mgnify:CR=1 FL=1